MNKVNRKIEYSLMALKHMSTKVPGELTTAKEVAESYHAPFDATARVMQLMASRGWLKSEHGAFGGYQITKDLSKVSMLDLLETIQGPSQITKCLNEEKCELEKNCNIVSPIANLNQTINTFYASLNLRELLLK